MAGHFEDYERPAPVYTLDQVVSHARARSPFYRALYAHLPPGVSALEQLPVLDHTAFWQANGLENNTVLAGPLEEGIVFKSGGTTGSPKFSPYTRAEWIVKTTLMGQGLARAGLAAGDRVANLFRGGDLYASFLSMGTAMLRCYCPVVEFPVGDFIDPDAILRALETHKINVLASFPTALLKLAEYVATRPRPPALVVNKILFAGESMYPDQREFIASVFHGARIRSLGYGSVDAGQIAYADERCGPDEFIAFLPYMLLELIDPDTGTPIEEAGRAGSVVVTNLARLLMPIIRYPAGDRAAWVDPPGADRRFRLLGRSEEGARVGVTNLYIEDVRKALAGSWKDLRLIDFQLVLEHQDKKDRLTLRLASLEPAGHLCSCEPEIRAQLFAQRPELKHAEESGEIKPLAFEWVRESDLERVPRTGKLRRVVDRRQG